MTVVETETAERAKQLREFTEALAKGPQPLAKLPKQLQDADALGYAAARGYIEFGRPGHCYVMDKTETKLKLEGDVEWTSLNQPWSKSIVDLLDEEEKMEAQLRLRVRLTHRR